MSGTLLAAPFWLRLLYILAIAGLLAGWPDHAHGGSAQNKVHMRLHHMQSQATGRCVQAVNRVSGDLLVNTCNECRLAQISHRRPTNGFPVRRAYRVPANGRIDLTFRGSGQTRVVDDSPCDPAPVETQDGHKDCAKLVRGKDGEPTLANACPVCRGVVIERVAGNGLRQRQVFTLTGLTMVPVPSRGAAGVRVITEMPCPKKQ